MHMSLRFREAVKRTIYGLRKGIEIATGFHSECQHLAKLIREAEEEIQANKVCVLTAQLC